ncbi:hypothetical protein BHE74_00031580 [Ensete ventricosum]|nr:hypothetical protein BHE74_00031580 [Ensete ventricosum]RZR89459.1 hypothetical protein BHM03_00017207 [Ensete ventricosum]
MNLSRCYGHTLLPSLPPSLPLDTARTHDAEAVTAVGWVPIQIRFLPDGVLRQARRRRPRPAPTPAFGLAVALPPKQDERTEPQKVDWLNLPCPVPFRSVRGDGSSERRRVSLDALAFDTWFFFFPFMFSLFSCK